jgi:hypothetical protein
MDYTRKYDPNDQHIYNMRFKIYNFDTIDTGLKHQNVDSQGSWNYRL